VLTTFASYQQIAGNLPRSLQVTAAKPQVARETAYYLANIGKVKSIDDLLANDRLFTFAMKAFGLGDMAYAKAFMRKVLEGGTDDSSSFANKLTDPRYKDFAAVFNFVRYGPATTAFDTSQQGAVDRYLRQTLEEDAGAQDEGVRLALYFQRKAPDITSPFGLLADPALVKFTQTALNIPAASSAMDIDKQAELIKQRLDIKDLQDPAKLQKLIQRFTALWDIQNQPATPSGPALLFSQPVEAGIGQDLLASLQKLRLGGH
jgi:hypothetical protein